MADPEGGKGVFVYIKASLTGNEPADVLNYQTCHATFPHQSTVNQWFTESQFESYRRLGQHIVETLFAGREAETRESHLISAHTLEQLRGLSTTQHYAKARTRACRSRVLSATEEWKSGRKSNSARRLIETSGVQLLRF
jgi:hypothetical protein